jgi:hypothetical protein
VRGRYLGSNRDVLHDFIWCEYVMFGANFVAAPACLATLSDPQQHRQHFSMFRI